HKVKREVVVGGELLHSGCSSRHLWQPLVPPAFQCWCGMGGGEPGEERAGVGVPIDQGGFQLPYRLEDPFVRKAYQEALEKEGAEVDIPQELYRQLAKETPHQK
ncbi:hypothetical protein ACFLWS_04165, partial [Chloroflexota bacterium]